MRRRRWRVPFGGATRAGPAPTQTPRPPRAEGAAPAASQGAADRAAAAPAAPNAATGTDLRARAESVAAAPDVTYQTRLRLPCTRSTWDALVDRPTLAGALWQAYGYGPTYQVTEVGDVIHVVDPTGLVGDLHRLDADGDRRRYLALGHVDHWAVPFMNAGEAVFTLQLEPAATVTGQLTVQVQAGSSVAGMVLRLGAPLLRAHVQNRIDLNLQDLGSLCGALETTPDQVRQRLDAPTTAALDAALGRTP